MPNNYVLLETVTVGAAGAASVTFNNIPQTGYTDLEIKTSVRTDNATIGNLISTSFNGSTANFTTKIMEGNGATVANANQTNYIGVFTGSSATANTFSNASVYIPNYTSSNHKSYSVDNVTENNATTALTDLWAGLWSNTAAITSITLTFQSTAQQYSSFSLYGIAAVGTTPTIAPKATGGDIVENDGTYWIHTFLSSGTFTPAVGLSCDYLVVAGGGAGGANRGSGGGAGGYLTSTFSAASSTNYTVTVGAGGSGTTTSGGNGSNSVFSTYTAIGGGGGRDIDGGNGLSGGSGGGAGGDTFGSTSKTGGNPTSGQGYKGGDAAINTGGAGAGGGGAGAAGGNITTSLVSGAGGTGLASSISGTSITRAGGGGGGGATAAAGGSGGGGAGGLGTTGTGAAGTAGTVNTGGGGGGSGRITNGAAGGSGIVIIRYPIA
jgi:hypothetical protein